MRNEELISLLEASVLFGLPKSTLTYYAKTGIIKPFCVIGKMQVYKKSHIENAIEKIRNKKKNANN